MANPLEMPTVALTWNADFANMLGGKPPALAVDMTEYVAVPDRDGMLARYSTSYAPDETGETFAVVRSSTPSVDFNEQIARGQRVVVGCAPLVADSWKQWDIGVAAPGQTLGAHETWTDFPAIALPLSGAGLRVWIGRLRSFEKPYIVDKTLSTGLSSNGEHVMSTDGPLPGLTRDEVARFCPRAVLIEPPRVGRPQRS